MAKDRAIGGIPGSPVQEIKRGNNYLFAIGINGYQHFPDSPMPEKTLRTSPKYSSINIRLSRLMCRSYWTSKPVVKIL
ncbi:MAG: hypothetical protein IPO25_02510 [Saprospiraceae bacterium]|nr:hypothetical protein [Saprospiraceae bacterium]